ncbi:esterase/lipase family protein [Vulcaniibacterium tengchongense]|uniref:PGAP1-like protein n=1 Tax=Vulcaniibacterium tengchongense TaxID=1273429 RepID=A0A3N4UVK7_9GAMM|nr:hypothetical protein [Vulcaniibacterium tengchongense]RPE74786.1 PGAP1-like protein [Vulcaniibacterium tengchongense]
MPQNNNEVIIDALDRDESGRPVARPRLTPNQDQRDKVCLMPPEAVIPVVFLPGIMGSNLKAKDGGRAVWRPPNMDGVGAILSALGQLFSYWFKGPATRQRELNPPGVEVDPRGSIETEGTLEREVARDRGWGTVMRSAYNPVMSVMEERLNNLMVLGEMMEWWNDEGRRVPSDYGDQKSNPPLTEDDLKHAAQYRYEVWGGGYNWLQSNVDSANDIKDYIENKVLASYPEDQRGRMKVILVTHSMGGFVARALTEIVGYEKVLGVVHGVMPATGAPAIYHHMRCGYEGVASVILGRDAAEVVAVAAYSPGALQLTPAFDYAGGKPWLKLGDGGASEPGRSLPTSGNPYDEIYKSRAWYGLIPEHNAKLINPAQLTGPAQESKDIYGGMSSLEAFDLTIDSVRSFHAELAKKYPKPAYCHYGADSGQKTWSEVRWQGTLTALPEQWQVEDDDGNGRLRLTNAGQHVELEFGPPEGMGDGTVSTESGSAPGEAGVQASFRQGNQADGAYARMNGKGKEQGYEHQDSYNDPRAQWATLYGIVRIARQADWSSC